MVNVYNNQEQNLKTMPKNIIFHRNYKDSFVSIRAKDFYFNSHHLAHAAHQSFENWLARRTTRELIDRLSRSHNLPEHKLLERIEYSHVNPQKLLWIHPNIAIAFAKSVSENFVDWVKLQINWVHNECDHVEVDSTGEIEDSGNDDGILMEIKTVKYDLKCDYYFTIRLKNIGYAMGVDLTDPQVAKCYPTLIGEVFKDSMARFN